MNEREEEEKDWEGGRVNWGLDDHCLCPTAQHSGSVLVSLYCVYHCLQSVTGRAWVSINAY